MSLSFVLVTLLAVLLLGALHVAFARAAPSGHLGELARDLTGGTGLPKSSRSRSSTAKSSAARSHLASATAMAVKA